MKPKQEFTDAEAWRVAAVVARLLMTRNRKARRVAKELAEVVGCGVLLVGATGVMISK